MHAARSVRTILDSSPGHARKNFSDKLAVEQHTEGHGRIFRECNVPIKPGCLVKIWHGSYANWGIELNGTNKELREWAKTRAEHYAKKDIDDADRYIDRNDLVIQPHTINMNTSGSLVARITAEIVKKIGESRDKDALLKIAVIGARGGSLIGSIVAKLRELDENIIDNIQFHILEPSEKKIRLAESTLPILGLNELRKTRKGGFSLEFKSDEQFFSTWPKEDLDMVVSFFHMHGKPFPDYLGDLRAAMKDDAALVIADTYSPMWQHPVFVYGLLEDINIGQKILEQFRDHFAVMPLDDAQKIITTLNATEIQSLRDHHDYWLKVAEELNRGRYEKSLYFLRAHTTVTQRKLELATHGFTTEEETIHKAFPGILESQNIMLPCRIDPASDFVTVMVALKQQLETTNGG
ncbi:MAG: hypothetical protein V1492_05345 [Candidatus Micrarchaeota archaeon]